MNILVSQVLDKLVADIEAGKNPWKKSWKGGGMPSNGVTHRTYRGINTLILCLAGMDQEYRASSWGTFKQWSSVKRFVKKGEKGTPIVFWKVLEKGEGDDRRNIPMLRVSWVFNEAQLDGEENVDPPAEVMLPEQCHANAEAWAETMGIITQYGQPSYAPVTDTMRMPGPEDFDSLDEFWSTFFHESVHWTGHKSRLDRGLVTSNKTLAYAREELVAEIGAAFLNAHFGIDTSSNNAAYLRHWLGSMPDKKEAIFTAAKEASKAFEFLTAAPQVMEQAA